MFDLDRSWHLDENEDEHGIAEFELQLWRLFWSFHHWIEECQKTSSQIPLTGLEVAMLHTIRQNMKPKTLHDLGRMLNRSDSHNIRYSVKKLLKYKLIEKVKALSDSHKNIAFGITEKGVTVTNDYAVTRKKALIGLIKHQKEMGFLEMAEKFIRMKSNYEEAERAAATYIKVNEAAPLETETVE